jgi:hypothetical protein
LNDNIEISDFLFISVQGLRLNDSFQVAPEFKADEKVVEIKIETEGDIDFKDVTYQLFDREHKFEPR